MIVENLRNKFLKLIRVPPNISLKERRYFYIGLLTTLFPLFFHLGMLILFGVLGVWSLFFLNIFSVLLYVYSFYLVYFQGNYLTAIILGAVEVFIHQVVCILGLGWDAGFQYYLISYILAIGLLPPKQKYVITFFEIVYALTYFTLSLTVKSLIPLYHVSSEIIFSLNIINVFIFLLLITLGMVYFTRTSWKAEEKAEAEFQRAEDLLHNILPVTVANRLKSHGEVIADDYECATVMFADIVDFTKIASDLRADQVVTLLNEVFSKFDELVEKYYLEKIKTIGDAYMVVSGAPNSCDDHSERIIEFAVDCIREIEKINERHQTNLRVRIGINSGPVVAGVIGKKKFIYDLWGDTVNIASRLEAYGIPGEIQVGEATYNLLKDKYQFRDRGMIEVKGKKTIHAYILVG